MDHLRDYIGRETVMEFRANRSRSKANMADYLDIPTKKEILDALKKNSYDELEVNLDDGFLIRWANHTGVPCYTMGFYDCNASGWFRICFPGDGFTYFFRDRETVERLMDRYETDIEYGKLSLFSICRPNNRFLDIPFEDLIEQLERKGLKF